MPRTLHIPLTTSIGVIDSKPAGDLFPKYQLEPLPIRIVIGQVSGGKKTLKLRFAHRKFTGECSWAKILAEEQKKQDWSEGEVEL